MKSTASDPESTGMPARPPLVLALAASLLLAPCLPAQTPATPVPGGAAQPRPQSEAEPKDPSSPDALPPGTPSGEMFHSLKFDGGTVSKLHDSLRREFPSDNFVLSESVERLGLPGFELRNVRLVEIGRTIEFLSEGQLGVEVAANAGAGNIWRIGRKNPAEISATVKMRSVAAPNLIANPKALEGILQAAEEMEMDRINRMGMIKGARGDFQGARLQPLSGQGIIAIMGGEEGVAGLEHLIQVAEQDQARQVVARTLETPRMKAVAAPHLFVDEERLGRFLQEFQIMTSVLGDKIDYRWETAGIPDQAPLYEAEIHPRREESIFMILGSEDAIAGAESLIQAAEQLAAVEDAREDAKLSLEQKSARDDARAKAKAEARAREKARLETHWREKAEKEKALEAVKEAAKEGEGDE